MTVPDPPASGAGGSSDAGEGPLDAGDFSAWLGGMTRALQGDQGSDVACGSCTACCTASQFILVSPDETVTLAHIPSALLFPAPRMPRGHLVMGYDERGHCPMLVDGACSIYEHRPRTCRTYDCRVFPAAGVGPEGAQQELIARRAERWRFRFDSPTAGRDHEAVQAAARFLRERAHELPEGAVPASPTQLAVLAIEIHGTFLPADEATDAVVVDPGLEAVAAAIARVDQRAGLPRARS